MREVIDYSKADCMKLKNDLANINWDLEVFDLLDIDEMYSKFTGIINTTIDKSCHSKTAR